MVNIKLAEVNKRIENKNFRINNNFFLIINLKLLFIYQCFPRAIKDSSAIFLHVYKLKGLNDYRIQLIVQSAQKFNRTLISNSMFQIRSFMSRNFTKKKCLQNEI